MSLHKSEERWSLWALSEMSKECNFDLAVDERLLAWSITAGSRDLGRSSGVSMSIFQSKFCCLVAVLVVTIQPSGLIAEQIPVRHIEGVTLGFLVLRTTDGQALAYGEYKQVVKPDGLVVADLRFEFKDGSFYEEVTRFTQRDRFRLVTDEVEQRGPAFKHASKSWIDARTGTITVRATEKGEEKTTTKHLEIPEDVSNGLLFVLLKNVDPSVGTMISFIAASSKPRVLKWDIAPGPEKTIKVGFTSQKLQHYVVKTKIQGPAGAIAPLIGKQPPDIHIWLAKSEAPTFVEFEGPLSEDNPVWRIELVAPEPDSQKAKAE